MLRHLQTHLIAALLACLVGCNTVHGAGEDISASGKAISKASTTTQEKI